MTTVTQKQIEEYERAYNVVYGEVGQPQKIVPGPEGPDFPLWKARRMVTALLKSQEEKATDADEREAFFHIRQTFHTAGVGDLVFGKIARFRNKKGKVRFVGIVEKDQDYTEAGKSRRERDPDYEPPKPSVWAGLSAPTGVSQGRRRLPPEPPQVSEAERIAGKMAKASREVAEGRNGS